MDLMDLATIEEIRQVKYRYLRCVDLKQWDELAGVFTPDATADYGTLAYGKPLKIAGRDEIVAFLRAKLGPDIITVHSAGQPEITVDGASAVLCHYPFRSWRGMDKGWVNLHGHSHGRLKPQPRQFDVGVDVWAFRPVTLPTILDSRSRR